MNSYEQRKKKENQLIEWSGCFWVVVITAIVMAVVYYGFFPFVHAMIDFYQLIPGF